MQQLLLVSPYVKSVGKNPHKPWMPPGALTEIPAMIPVGSNWDARIWDESVRGAVPLDVIKSADLLALTFLTPSRYNAIDLAIVAKGLGKQVIAGGRDIIGWCQEENGMAEIHAIFPSVCTTTLGKDLMGQILADAVAGDLKPQYALSRGEQGEMPLPRHDLIDSRRYFAGCTIRSSEGCRLNCEFCTVGGRGYFIKPAAILADETQRIKSWFFLDVSDSFAGDIDFVMNTVLPLYKATGKSWGTEIPVKDAMQIIDGHTLIWHMAQAGCRLLYFGLESVTRDLKNSKSSKALAEQAIEECRRNGIIVIGALILDMFGDETEEEIDAMIDWSIEWLDFAQYSLVAALPGCLMRKKALAEGRILNQGHENWENYDGAHPTLIHWLSPETRCRKWHEAYTRFSEMANILRRAKRARGLVYKIGSFAGGIRYRQEIPSL